MKLFHQLRIALAWEAVSQLYIDEMKDVKLDIPGKPPITFRTDPEAVVMLHTPVGGPMPSPDEVDEHLLMYLDHKEKSVVNVEITSSAVVFHVRDASKPPGAKLELLMWHVERGLGVKLLRDTMTGNNDTNEIRVEFESPLPEEMDDRAFELMERLSG